MATVLSLAVTALAGRARVLAGWIPQEDFDSIHDHQERTCAAQTHRPSSAARDMALSNSAKARHSTIRFKAYVAGAAHRPDNWRR